MFMMEKLRKSRPVICSCLVAVMFVSALLFTTGCESPVIVISVPGIVEGRIWRDGEWHSCWDWFPIFDL